MFESQLKPDDALSGPIALSEKPGPYTPCLRIVWRKGSDGIYHAVGSIYTVESAAGVVAGLNDPVNAIAKAESLNQTLPQQPSILLSVPLVKIDETVVIGKIHGDLRFHSQNRIPGVQPTLGQALGVSTPRS